MLDGRSVARSEAGFTITVNLERNNAGSEHGHHLHVLVATLTIRRLLDTQFVFI